MGWLEWGADGVLGREAHHHLPRGHSQVASTKTKGKDPNHEARWPACPGMPHEVLYFVLLSAPPTPRGGTAVLHRQTTEVARGFPAGEPVSESSGSEVWVRKTTCNLEHLWRRIKRNCVGDSRTLIETQVAMFSTVERTWGLQVPQMVSHYHTKNPAHLNSSEHRDTASTPSLAQNVQHTPPPFASDFQLHWYNVLNVLKIWLLFGKINTAVG